MRRYSILVQFDLRTSANERSWWVTSSRIAGLLHAGANHRRSHRSAHEAIESHLEELAASWVSQSRLEPIFPSIQIIEIADTPAVSAHMIRAVMFDMDGVLIDSEPVHKVALQAVLAAYGLPVPGDADWEPVFLGRPDRDGLLDWFRLHGIEHDPRPLMDDKQIFFAERFDELVTPHADGQWLARALAELGVPLALVSGARRNEIELTLERFNLRSLFQATVSADDVSVGKPDPEPYLRGAEALGVDPRETLVIEDAPAGMRAALAAGARVVVVDRYGTPELFDGVVPLDRLDERVVEMVTSPPNPPATREERGARSAAITALVSLRSGRTASGL